MKKKSFGRRLLLFFHNIPIVFYLTLILVNPIVNRLGFVDLWEYGLNLFASLNPTYKLLELTHLFLALVVTLLFTLWLDRRYQDSDFYKTLFLFNRRRFTFVVLLALIAGVAYFIIGQAIFYDFHCAGGDLLGCVDEAKFNYYRLFKILLLVFYTVFWVSGLFLFKSKVKKALSEEEV